MNTAKSRVRLSAHEAGPLLSYVREDDTHETLLARLEAMVGGSTSTDWSSLRLAVVCRDNIPRFIPRANVSSPRTTPAVVLSGSETKMTHLPAEEKGADMMQVEEQAEEKKGDLEELEGGYVAGGGVSENEGDETSKGEKKVEVAGKVVWQLFQKYYPDFTLFAERPSSTPLLSQQHLPLLGLQRPTAEQSSMGGKGGGKSNGDGVRRVNSGVKIN